MTNFVSLPEFSIIVPVYNAEKQLQRCLGSIIGQSDQDFKCIPAEDLEILPELQGWFSAKYAPEIVNGVLYAVKNRLPQLRRYLAGRLRESEDMLLCSNAVSHKIKFRCRFLRLMQTLHLL